MAVASVFPDFDHPEHLISRENEFRQFSQEEMDTLFALATRPALLLTKTEFREMQGAPGCWLGGLPTLPNSHDWPWVLRDGEPYYPMHHLAQIRLDSLPMGEDFELIPRQGTLFFFASTAEYQEGTPGTVSVIHVEGDVSGCAERPMPEFPPEVLDYEDVETTDPYARWPVTVRRFDSLNWEFSQNRVWQQAALDRVVPAGKALFESRVDPATASGDLRTPRYGGVVHTMFDFLGDRDRNLMRKRHIPLLRIETDEDLGFLYFHYLGIYIPPEALKARDFSQAFGWTLT